MSRSRNLSDVFNPDSEIVNNAELITGLVSASSAAVSYVDSEISTIDLSSTIQTASAAAFSSASAYTDSAIASFEALPSQTGNNGKYLTTNGSSTSWATLDLNSAIQTASAGAVTYLVNSAPSTLDTLNELATALGNDANFSTTVTNSLASKLNTSTASATYLTQSSAASNYLTIANASSTYLPLSGSTSFYRWTKTYSGSASIISGTDDNLISLSYNPGYIQLFINGVMLDPSEYTANSGSSITVVSPVLSGEVVDIFSFVNSVGANIYSQSQINDAFLTKSSASSTYLTQSSASSTYLTQSSASSTYSRQGYGEFAVRFSGTTPITVATQAATTAVPLNSSVFSKNITLNTGTGLWTHSSVGQYMITINFRQNNTGYDVWHQFAVRKDGTTVVGQSARVGTNYIGYSGAYNFTYTVDSTTSNYGIYGWVASATNLQVRLGSAGYDSVISPFNNSSYLDPAVLVTILRVGD